MLNSELMPRRYQADPFRRPLRCSLSSGVGMGCKACHGGEDRPVTIRGLRGGQFSVVLEKEARPDVAHLEGGLLGILAECVERDI